MELVRMQGLFIAQPTAIRSFLEDQADILVGDILGSSKRTGFQLPEQIVVDTSLGKASHCIPVDTESRKNIIPGWIASIFRTNILSAVSQRLTELEGSPNKSISVSAGLVRYSVASYLVHRLLPGGEPVEYQAAQGEEIPSLPVSGRFYLPQWVAFDAEERLLVSQLSEADAYMASMQLFMMSLHYAVTLAPYMVADSEYQLKRYGMFGQIVNQGRALARYRIAEMIAEIKQLASTHNLNRGFHLSLPYFDDQSLDMMAYEFEVVPAGRIEFVPAFVVRSARQESVKVAQNIGLSSSTRKHLILSLRVLEQAFSQIGK
jgi:hypothetical protein